MLFSFCKANASSPSVTATDGSSKGYIRFYSMSVPGTRSAGRLLWKMGGSKQLFVYISILNVPLVNHRGYRTNYPSHLLTDFHGCTHSLLGQISHFLYESVHALVFIDYHVKVKPDTCFSLLRILLAILYLLSKYIISKRRKNLKQMKIKPNISSLFTCLFLPNDTSVHV